MKRRIVILPSLIITVVIGLAASIAATAQPHGWGCDYGYRPGNKWFYSSTSFQGKVYSQTVVRDSVGMDGTYWVYVATPIFSEEFWYRIDSSCTFDHFLTPSDTLYQRSFLGHADSGAWWVVDTFTWQTPLHARVDAIYHHRIFGKQVTSKDVVYYPGNQSVESWDYSQEWAEGLGIISKWRHPNGHDEIVGAIIDGVAYGDTTVTVIVGGVDDRSIEDTKRIYVHPLPASTNATLSIAAYGERHATVEIFDILGRLVQHKHLDALSNGVNVISLDLNGFTPGSFLIAVDLDGKRYITPLVVAP